MIARLELACKHSFVDRILAAKEFISKLLLFTTGVELTFRKRKAREIFQPTI